VAELNERPKYSVIDFCSAIEVFLKARLLLEHWTLIIEKPERANPDEFRAGAAATVTMDQAISRLESIANEKISKEELACFRQIRDHRNRLVHFFDKRYVRKPDENTLYDLVAEQCKGWFYLHRLITKNWRAQFIRFLDKIDKLNELMHRQRAFLKATSFAFFGDRSLGHAWKHASETIRRPQSRANVPEVRLEGTSEGTLVVR